jgi:C-terminal processing protease CtpA/Prc
MDVQAFIIDMRGNPGGLCPGGVGMASLFLDENKPVVNVMDKKGIVDSQVTFGSGIDLGKSTGSVGRLKYGVRLRKYSRLH